MRRLLAGVAVAACLLAGCAPVAKPDPVAFETAIRDRLASASDVDVSVGPLDWSNCSTPAEEPPSSTGLLATVRLTGLDGVVVHVQAASVDQLPSCTALPPADMSEVAYFRVLETAGVSDVIAIGRLSDTQWSPSGGEIAVGDARVQAADCYVVTALPARNATGSPESRMRVVLLDQSTERATDLGWLDALGQ